MKTGEATKAVAVRQAINDLLAFIASDSIELILFWGDKTFCIKEVSEVATRSSQTKVKKVKESLSRLSNSEIMEIDKMIHDRLETRTLMKIAESGFTEWEDPEEDIYNDEV